VLPQSIPYLEGRQCRDHECDCCNPKASHTLKVDIAVVGIDSRRRQAKSVDWCYPKASHTLKVDIAVVGMPSDGRGGM